MNMFNHNEALTTHYAALLDAYDHGENDRVREAMAEIVEYLIGKGDYFRQKAGACEDAYTLQAEAAKWVSMVEQGSSGMSFHYGSLARLAHAWGAENIESCARSAELNWID